MSASKSLKTKNKQLYFLHATLVSLASLIEEEVLELKRRCPTCEHGFFNSQLFRLKKVVALSDLNIEEVVDNLEDLMTSELEDLHLETSINVSESVVKMSKDIRKMRKFNQQKESHSKPKGE